MLRAWSDLEIYSAIRIRSRPAASKWIGKHWTYWTQRALLRLVWRQQWLYPLLPFVNIVRILGHRPE